MKEAAKHELEILEANRIGVDRNVQNIIKQTASHVGLQLPKGY